MNKKSAYPVKRKHVRFKPDPGAYAQICLDVEAPKFEPELLALILDESGGGCGLVTLTSKTFHRGDRVKVKVGELAPVLSEVCWVIPIDQQIQKIGLHYQE